MSTIMGCVHQTPVQYHWKLLSIQQLIPAQKGICIFTERERESVQAVLPSVWPKVSLVDYVTQQWQWPFTVGACSNSWKAYKHASLSHQDWHCPLANAGLQYVFIFTNECPSFWWKANKKQAIAPKHFNTAACGTDGITRVTRPSITACTQRQKRWDGCGCWHHPAYHSNNK